MGTIYRTDARNVVKVSNGVPAFIIIGRMLINKWMCLHDYYFVNLSCFNCRTPEANRHYLEYTNYWLGEHIAVFGVH